MRHILVREIDEGEVADTGEIRVTFFTAAFVPLSCIIPSPLCLAWLRASRVA